MNTTSLLTHFNAVLDSGQRVGSNPIIDYDHGIIVMPSAVDQIFEIRLALKNMQALGQDLNKTFQRSWSDVERKTHGEMVLEQFAHYCCTYGSDFESDFVYVPNTDPLPVEITKFKVISALTKPELDRRIVSLLNSGIALKSQTVEDFVYFLSNPGESRFENREANIISLRVGKARFEPAAEEIIHAICSCCKDPHSPNRNLLINDEETRTGLKEGLKERASYPRPMELFLSVPPAKFAPIFNRYKWFFMSLRSSLTLRPVINEISRKSKTLHVPSNKSPLFDIANISPGGLRDALASLGVSNSRLFSIINYLAGGSNTHRMFKIRNGRVWSRKHSPAISNRKEKLNVALDVLRRRCDIKGKTFYMESSVDLALPISQKNFVGNLPFGTAIKRKSLAAGIYWKNAWGARDLDLSAININGDRIGWNAGAFASGDLTYSGDVTNAPRGAAEYFKIDKNAGTVLLVCNIYTGDLGARAALVIGDPKESKAMMSGKVHVNESISLTTRQSILGMYDNHKFYVGQLSYGNGSVSSSKPGTIDMLESYSQSMKSTPRLRNIIEFCGGTFVNSPEEADIDLSLSSLTINTLFDIFQ